MSNTRVPSSVHRLAVLAICAIALIVLPGTSVWATASAVGARTLAFVTRTVAPAFGFAAAAPPPPPPAITATKSAAFPAGGDVDADGKADPGDTIRYTVTVSDATQDASNVHVADTPDANTTFVGGSIVISSVAINDTYASVGNMTLTSASIGADCAANALHSITCNDTLNSGTLSGFGATQGTAAGTAVNGSNTVSTSNGGTVLLNTDGTFVYNPAAGFEGADTFWYTLSAGVAGTDNASVTINVGGANGMVWFITPSPGGSPTGRQANPISLDGFRPLNTGVGSNPAAGDTIFLLEGAHALTATLALLGTQKVIGQDTTATLAQLTAPTAQPGNAYPAVNNPTGTDVSITSSAAALTLSSGNTLAGFTVGNATTAITGGAVGTLNVRDVKITTNGSGLVISTSGALGVTAPFTGFSSITTTGGTNGISLTGVTGTFNTTISLAGASGTTFNVSGGTFSGTLSGGITQGNNAAMVSVTGGHTTGTLTFQSGTLSATNGTGLQFDNADGTYNFNGTTTLNGGNAGIDILNGSAGTFAFGATTITNPSGIALNVDGSSGAVTGPITISGAISKTGIGRLIEFNNYDTATATISGALTCNTSCQGIDVTNNGTSSGTVNFTNATNTLNTGIDTAVNLDNNDGGTINFSGGNLDIVTTSGTGFNAINGGTVNVTGSSNSITSTSATALNIVGTTIGASNLTFHDISSGNNTIASDPADGIVLNTTGAGRLIVTGDGNTTVGGNNSGGVIQHTSNYGISLTSTQDPSFTNMAIHDIARNGIDGTGVVSFTFDNGQVTNTGTGVAGQYEENAFAFVDAAVTANTVSGTVTITDSLISGAHRNAIMIETWNGTISSVNISNNVMSGGSDAGALKDATLATTADIQDAIHVFSQGSASATAHITTGTINNNTISGFEFFSTTIFIGGNGIRVAGGSGNATNSTSATLGTVANPIEISGNDVDNTGSNAIAVSFNGQQGISNFNIHHNGTVADPMSSAEGLGISVFFGGSGTFSALVNNNAIDTNGPTVHAGSSGLAVQLDDGPAALGNATGLATIHVNNNTITNPDGFGIRGIARASNGTLNLYVQNNDVGTPGLTNREAIRIDSGSSAGDVTLNLNMTGNSGPLVSTTDNLVGSGVDAGIGVRKQGTVATTNEFNIQGISAGPTNAQVQAFVGGNNHTADGSGGSVNGVDIISGSNYGTTNSVPLLFAAGGIESAGRSDIRVLTQAELDGLVTPAIDRWTATRLSADQITAIRGMTIEVADLPSAYLAEVAGDRLRIDPDASGRGWFIDRTPASDALFPRVMSPTRRYTEPSLAPAGRVDLLTAILHEMGHRLDYPDSYQASDRDSLMYGYLTVGERRLPGVRSLTTIASRSSFGFPFFAPPRPSSFRHALRLEPDAPPQALAAIPVAPTGTAIGPSQVMRLRAFLTNLAAADAAEQPLLPRSNQFAAGDALSHAIVFARSVARAVAEDTLAFVRRVPDLLSATLEARTAAPVDVDVAPLLPIGKTVRVVFDVTVNGPNAVAQYSNFATVSGSNFSLATTNTATTTGDRYATSTALISSLNPVDQGLAVTFTATVSPTEGSGLTPDGTVQFKDSGSNLGSAVPCADAGSNTCSAQLTTSALSGGSTHPITAVYSGGTYHDPSTSNTVSQQVVACVTNPVVQNNANTGAGSLRQAILDACTNNTITFNMGSVVSPLGVTNLELELTRNVTIDGPGADVLTVTSTNAVRVFKVDSGVTATIRGLTIAGAGGGGGIRNAGNLTITDSALTGNTTTSTGGAISNDGNSGSATLTITNSSISGNSAVDGGAIENYAAQSNFATLSLTNVTISGNTASRNGGAIDHFEEPGGNATATLTNVTITNNRSDSDGNADGSGGGITTNGSTTTVLRNTIVARNFRGLSPGTTADDVNGTINGGSSNNLIGNDTGLSGLTDGVNGNLVGSAGSPIDPKLGPLANNGGPTLTHKLLTGSPALEAGDNTLVVAPPFLNTSPITDQRGSGFDRIRDAADANTTQTVDIGALEADPTVEDITDKSTNEETPLAFTFNIGDAATGFGAITASSSNTTLLPNANAVVSADTASTRTLTLTPALNQVGTTTVTVTVGSATDTFVLTVTGINDPPTLTAITNPAAIPEDSGLQTVNLSGISAGGSADESGQTLTVTATSDNHALIPDPTVSYASPGATGSVSYTPVADANGTAVVTVTVTDNGGLLGGGIDTFSRTFMVTVNPGADTPSVTNATTNEDTQTTSGLVISRNVGDGAEVTHFKITGITNGLLFQANGSTPIANGDFITFAQGNAGLRFTPSADFFGTGSFTVEASVSGVDAGLGGGAAIATIAVNPVADTPSVTNASTTLNTQTTSGLVISRNAADTAEVTHFKITNITNGTLYQNNGTTPITDGQFITYADGNAGLKFTPTTGSVAPGSFQVQGAVDGAGTGLSSGSATATITLPCTTDPVVTTNSDSGAGSLRNALAIACGSSTITFNMGSVTSPIGLTSAQLTIDRDLTIAGPGADLLAIQRTSGAFRIIGILANHTVTLSGLTIANGSAFSQGGGILNTHSILTIVNSALTGNTVDDGFGGGSGGAIYNDGNPASASLTLVNTTLSGNQAAGYGGAVYAVGFNGGTSTVSMTNTTLSGNTAGVAGGMEADSNDAAHGLVTLTNSTITANRGTVAVGGLGTMQGTHTLVNTIVAGNVRDASPSITPDDVSAVLNTATSFNNLIGYGGGMIGVTNGVNGNLVGSPDPIDPRLGPLAFNGGPTMTHALLAGSPALDAGDNTFVVAPPFAIAVPITDQRGPGFERIRDAADANLVSIVDIGALEADPAVEDIANKSTAEDTALPAFIFNVGDSDSAFDAITATSNNQTLLPNANVVVGADTASTRTLTLTPVPDQTGTATVTVSVTKTLGGAPRTMTDTFVLTVTAVNDPPTLDPIADPPAVNEDSGTLGRSLQGITAGDSESQTLTVTATSNNTALIPDPTVTYTSPNTTGLLIYTPVANANGSAIITVTVDDGGTGTHTVVRTFTVNVTAVNDAPTLDAIANPSAILEDAAQQTVNLTGVGSGAANESQTLTVTALSNNPALIPNPTVTYTSADATGSLSYTPVANASGSALITVTVTDNGGVLNGGVNAVSQTFTVNVTNVNDPPTLNAISDPSAILEDAGQQTVNLAGIGTGASNEAQTLTVTASSNNTALIPNPTVTYTSANATGSLSYTPVANANGSAIITVTVDDGGSGTHTVTQTFTVNVTSVNDAPTLDAIADPLAILEDAGLQTVNLTGITAGPGETQTLTVTALSNNTGLIPNPTVSYTSANPTGSLSYTPVADMNGSAMITVTVDDGGSGTHTVTRTFTVTVNATNDLPTITPIADQSFPANTSLGVPITVGDVDTAAGALIVTATSSNQTVLPNGGLVVSGSGASRTLTLTPAVNQAGSATITVTVNDGTGTTSTTFVAQVLPSLTIGDATMMEGNSGSANLVFTVTLAGPSAGTASVHYATHQRTAIEGVDYAASAGTLTIPSGMSTGTIMVPVMGDTTVEINETFVVDLSSATGAVIGDAQALGTIINDDVSPPQTAALVNWVRPLGVTATAGNLTKTVGPGWNAGALSRQAIVSGDTSVEFSPTTTSEVVALGLSKGDVNTDIDDIDFAIELFLDQYFVVEHGVMLGGGSQGTFAAGDRFAVTVAGGVVTYQRNGVTFFTSSATPLYRLRVDTALYTTGAALADVVFTGPLVQSAYRPGDFDGDGQADLDIYRPASGGWYNLLSKAGYTSFTAIPFGVAADLPVAGDFDGDSIADLAVYRPSTGVWFVLTSSTYFTTVASYSWGAAGDVPVPADYDGDGTTDLAVFRPSTGQWFRLLSSQHFTTSQINSWGAAGDVPVSGDYDGDGLADLVVFRPSTGTWFILQSSSNFTTFVMNTWGAANDIAVPGDFDGDGKADLALFRPSTGVWYIRQSSTNFATYFSMPWGAAGDVPVMGDYDGDGRADIVVFRPSTGTWFVLLSSTNYTTYGSFLWGFGNQYPVLRRQ